MREVLYNQRMKMRLIFALALMPYALWLMIDYQYHFIDGANLLIHEAGHVLFGLPGNRFLMVAGGTLLQLALPLIFAGHLVFQRDRFGASLCLFWFAESLMYSAVYLGDAKVGKLPLFGVGKVQHDWLYLLKTTGLLNYCTEIAFMLHVVASVLLCLALYFAVQASAGSVAERREAPDFSGG